MSVNEKNQLIEKLEAISILRDKALSIKDKMNNFVPEDNYERKIVVPAFPEGLNWEKVINHSKNDATEKIANQYDSHYAPKKPEQPKIKDFEYIESSEYTSKQSKLGCISYAAAGIGAFFLLSLIIGSAEGAVGTIIVITLIAAAVFALLRYKIYTEKNAEAKKKAVALNEYNIRKDELWKDYNEKGKRYETELVSYEAKKKAFLVKYADWRKIYLESDAEENDISTKLEADRVAAVEKINTEEFQPVLQDLAVLNDIVTVDYLAAVDIFVDLLKSGRADDLKEAINLYEEMLYRERQLQFEKEKEEQRRYEEAKKQEAMERYQEEQLQLQREQEYNRKREAEKQMQLAEKHHKEEMQLHEKQARDAKLRYEKERKSTKRCVWCAHKSTCRQQYYDGAYNCTGFTPTQ